MTPDQLALIRPAVEADLERFLEASDSRLVARANTGEITIADAVDRMDRIHTEARNELEPLVARVERAILERLSPEDRA